MKQLIIFKYKKAGANGDRAPHSNTPYFDYELKYGDFVIYSITGYDNWYCNVISDQNSIQLEMENYANDFAEVFSLPKPIVKTMELKIVKKKHG